MEYSAIFHDMDKRFCYAIDKDLFVIRVQVKKDDMNKDYRQQQRQQSASIVHFGFHFFLLLMLI